MQESISEKKLYVLYLKGYVKLHAYACNDNFFLKSFTETWANKFTNPGIGLSNLTKIFLKTKFSFEC